MVKKINTARQNVVASATSSDRASAAQAAVVILVAYVFNYDLPPEVAAFAVFLSGLIASVVEKKKASR